ncbi:pyruvate formate lyase family protein [Nonomuraea sp. NPDC050022]|uniref:pyruvate formate lyase family protein n=1 Tax=Nonomuraea sp. NPDC050022 TaxID=3364358 RepID=UPI0037899F5F
MYEPQVKPSAPRVGGGPFHCCADWELIVGLQTDAPLKRAIMPAGGPRMVESGLAAYGHILDPLVRKIFTKYRKTHNDGCSTPTPPRSGAPAGRA